MNYVYLTLIIKDEYSKKARMICEKVGGISGSGMFSAPLSADGHAPATHWCSSGAIGEEFAAALRDAAVMHAVCQQAGIAITLDECRAILSSAEIVSLATEDVASTLERVGLALIVSM